MKINCDVVNDLLPLYVDGALSEASKELVEDHIRECESCSNTLENMKEAIRLPVNQEVRIEETKSLKGLKRMVSNWKKLTAVIALLSVVAIMVLSVMYLNTKTLEVPYDGSNVTIEKHDDGYYLHYHGKGEILYSANGDINSGEWTIEFSQTLWGKYIHPLYDDKDTIYWCFEIGEITKLTTMDGTVIWEGSEEDIKAHEQWIIDHQDQIEH